MKVSEVFLTGSIGEVVTLHAKYYQSEWGFGVFFEAKVASEIAEFTNRKTAQDLILIAYDEDGVAASLILDVKDPLSSGRGSHLRWFIVADRCRGTGIGRQLIERAVSHATTHTNGRMWLTTFAGLEPARHLYESFGFELVSETEGDAWGTIVKEQEFRR